MPGALPRAGVADPGSEARGKTDGADCRGKRLRPGFRRERHDADRRVRAAPFEGPHIRAARGHGPPASEGTLPPMNSLKQKPSLIKSLRHLHLAETSAQRA